MTTISIEGKINGTALWHQLTPAEQKIKSAWSSPTGAVMYCNRMCKNPARIQQIRMMLDVYTKRMGVTWSGSIDKIVKLTGPKSVTPAVAARIFKL